MEALCIIATHLCGDFIIQNDWMAREKRSCQATYGPVVDNTFHLCWIAMIVAITGS